MGFRIVMEWNVDTDKVHVEVRQPAQPRPANDDDEDFERLPPPSGPAKLRMLDPVVDDES